MMKYKVEVGSLCTRHIRQMSQKFCIHRNEMIVIKGGV